MRPLYDLASAFTAQIRTAEEEAGRVFEPVIAIVTDNRDPQKLGRVKVQIPVLSMDDTTWWAPVVMPGAGKNRGWFFIPEVKDEVLVLFEHGDMDRPIVIGAMWNGKDKTADHNSDGKNDRRVLRSRAGGKITLDDSGSPKIIIEDAGKKGRITIDSTSNTITIEALDGDACFQAPAGDVKVVAQSAKLKANSAVELYAGSSMAWGADGSVTVKGSQVTVSGSQAQLNGGGAQAPQAPSANVADINDPYEA